MEIFKNLPNENYIAKLGWNSIIYIYGKRANLGQKLIPGLQLWSKTQLTKSNMRENAGITDMVQALQL